jgi:hypothetical protein
MRSLADEMAIAGRVIEEEELVEYILADLGQEYDPIMFDVITQTSDVSISKLYSQLLAFETRRELMYAHDEGGSLVNDASRGRDCSSRNSFGRSGN